MGEEDGVEVDRILGDIEDMPLFLRKHRAQILKDALKTDTPDSFWAKSSKRVVRRKVAPSLSTGASLPEHSRRQWEAIEASASVEIDVDGEIIYVGDGARMVSNPCAAYTDKELHLEDIPRRLLSTIRRYHRMGLLKLVMATDLVGLDRAQLIEMLLNANYPSTWIDRLPGTDGKLRAFVLAKLNTFYTKIYGDGAAVVATWPVSLWWVDLLYFSHQWKDGMTAEEFAKVEEELVSTVKPDMLAMASATHADTTALTQMIAHQFANQPAAGTPLGTSVKALTLDDIAALVAQQSAAAPGGDASASSSSSASASRASGGGGGGTDATASVAIRFAIGRIDGDGAHINPVLGLASKGRYHDPMSLANEDEQMDGVCLLLKPRRTVKEDVTKRFRNGPCGDASRSYNKPSKPRPGSVNMGVRSYLWELGDRNLGPPPPKVVGEAAEEAKQIRDRVKGHLMGANVLSGLCDGVVGNATKEYLAKTSGAADAMHCLGGHIHNVVDFGIGDLDASPREAVWNQLMIEKLKERPGCTMYLRKWYLLGVELCRPNRFLGNLGITLPDPFVSHLLAAVQLRKLLYTNMRDAHTRGHIVSQFCVLIKFRLTLDAMVYADPEKVMPAKTTEEKMFGWYPTGGSHLVMSGRLLAPAQVVCERPESFFKHIKKMFKSRSKMHWDAQQLHNLIRCLLAMQVKRKTNSTKGEQENKRAESMATKAWGEIAPMYAGDARVAAALPEGKDGEVWTFTAEEVKTPFFVITWLKWLGDYIMGQHASEHIWWEGVGQFSSTKVREVKIFCDRAVDTGAVLMSAFWLSEVEMEAELLELTKNLCETHRHLPFPGWKNVGCAIDSLLTASGFKEEVRRPSLKAFLMEIGAMRQSQRG